MPNRRFPAPWRADKMPGGYVVRDANGQALVWVYSPESEAEAMQAKVLTADEARRIAVNVAKPPGLLAAASLRRHVLPKDLPAAIKQLDDQELDRLLASVLAEQKRRGRKPAESVQTPGQPREAAVFHLTPGKMNAVRAAFKAGVKPSQIARQFGLSQSDVRKALASRVLQITLKAGPAGASIRNWGGGAPRARGRRHHRLRHARMRSAA